MISKKERLYSLLRKIPRGKVTTYKQLAHALNTKGYRLIGQMLKHNPDAPHIPCHRVVRSNGTLGGYMGKTTGQEIKKKIALLSDEGINCINGKIEDFVKKVFYLHKS